MSVSFGQAMVALVTEQGALRLFSTKDSSWKNCFDCFGGQRVVMVSIGQFYIMCVTDDGALWSCHRPSTDKVCFTASQAVLPSAFGNSPAVMVAVGTLHVLLLTAAGCAWVANHQDPAAVSGNHINVNAWNLLHFACAETGWVEPTLVMVSAGMWHSVVLGKQGQIWTWGHNEEGQLGQNDTDARLVPTLVPGLATLGSRVVLVTAGASNTLAVSEAGALWGCGNGDVLRGDRNVNSPALILLGAPKAFGGSQVLSAACGFFHTLVVTKAGTLWSIGFGKYGSLGHGNFVHQRVPRRIRLPRHNQSLFVAVYAGGVQSCAVTACGRAFVWGLASVVEPMPPPSSMHTPKLFAEAHMWDVCVGRCHRRSVLPPLFLLAFAMGTHARLGAASEADAERRVTRAGAPAARLARGSALRGMPADVIQLVALTVGSPWPPGPAGEWEGMLRLLGGGHVARVSRT